MSRALVRLLPLGAALLAGPLAVRAQVPPAVPQPPMPAEEDPGETEAVEASPADPEGAPPAGVEGTPGEVGTDGVYTVKTGDTLWDLSQQFLSNPWYWPKIWAENPEVENPHWIYPGNRLRLRTAGDGLPGEVEPAAPAEEAADDVLPQKAREIAGFTTGTIHRADSLGVDPDVVTFAGGPPNAGAGAPRLRLASVLLTAELEQAGVVSGSFEQKALLASGDSIYAKFPDLDGIAVGSEFAIVRPRAEVFHPVTGAPAGVLTDVLGSVKIVAREQGTAIGLIGRVNDSIERGDRLARLPIPDLVLARAPNRKDLSGVILTSDINGQTTIGESHVVFIDKGARDGVAAGNTFTVVHSGDGLLAIDTMTSGAGGGGMPLEPVATLLVVDVRETASAAIVVRSLREVSVGDRVEMRAPGGTAGAGGDVR